jgi:hypothetical protein
LLLRSDPRDRDAGDLYRCCTSDQLRFCDPRGDQPLALADVPLLVFTEGMRDVDLSDGVTSIGADPECLDRGEGRRLDTYWHRYSFGASDATPLGIEARVAVRRAAAYPIGISVAVDGSSDKANAQSTVRQSAAPARTVQPFGFGHAVRGRISRGALMPARFAGTPVIAGCRVDRFAPEARMRLPRFR